MKSRILAIVVTYNGMKWVDRCLGSLVMSRTPADVIVIDNGSQDGTQEYIAENYPEVKLVSTGENFGFGKANNIGLKHALEKGYEYVYLLNQDAWVYPDTLGVLMEAMENDSRVTDSYASFASMRERAFSTVVAKYRPEVGAAAVEEFYNDIMEGRI